MLYKYITLHHKDKEEKERERKREREREREKANDAHSQAINMNAKWFKLQSQLPYISNIFAFLRYKSYRLQTSHKKSSNKKHFLFLQISNSIYVNIKCYKLYLNIYLLRENLIALSELITIILSVKVRRAHKPFILFVFIKVICCY